MSKLILLIGFLSVFAFSQVVRESFVEPRLRGGFAPRPTVVEALPAPVYAPRYIPPLGYDNYGNANVEHPYAYINDESGAAVIEPEVSHSYGP